MSNQTNELNQDSHDTDYIDLGQDLEDPKPLDLTGEWTGVVTGFVQDTGKSSNTYYRIVVTIDTARGPRKVRGRVFPGSPLPEGYTPPKD